MAANPYALPTSRSKARTTRPGVDPIVAMYTAQAEANNLRNSQMAIAKQLVEKEGFDPKDIQEWMQSGKDVRALIPKPKPTPTTAQQAIADLKAKAQEISLKKRINPTREYTDPVTGQMFDIEHDADTRRRMIPQQFADDSARFRPKLGAFKGRDEQGTPWEMDRGEYGQAENYRTKPGKNPIIKKTDSSGRISAYEQTREGDGINLRPMPVTVDGESSLYDTKRKIKWRSPDSLVQGEANQDEHGNWNEGTAKYGITDTTKNFAKEYAIRTKKINGDLLEVNEKIEKLQGIKGESSRKQIAEFEKIKANMEKRLQSLDQHRNKFKDALTKHGMIDRVPGPDVENQSLSFDEELKPANSRPRPEAEFDPSVIDPEPAAPMQSTRPTEFQAPEPVIEPEPVAEIEPPIVQDFTPPKVKHHRVRDPFGKIRMIPEQDLEGALTNGGSLFESDE